MAARASSSSGPKPKPAKPLAGGRGGAGVVVLAEDGDRLRERFGQLVGHELSDVLRAELGDVFRHAEIHRAAEALDGGMGHW
jgi:hypothetical protein